MDSISPLSVAPSNFVEDDAEAREAIVRTLTQASDEADPPSSGEDAFDLMAVAEFDGLYCAIELPGRVDGREVGTTFSVIWPDCPVVNASAISAPPGPLRKGVFLRKPLVVRMLAKAFEPARVAGTVRAGSAAHTKPKNLTATWIKPTSSFVHLA
jgi:DNA-binding LytR/AlgR family response regulator